MRDLILFFGALLYSGDTADLGNPSWAVRQRAEMSLRTGGFLAMPYLEKHAKDGNPESQARAANIIGDYYSVAPVQAPYPDVTIFRLRRLVSGIFVQDLDSGLPWLDALSKECKEELALKYSDVSPVAFGSIWPREAFRTLVRRGLHAGIPRSVFEVFMRRYESYYIRRYRINS